MPTPCIVLYGFLKGAVKKLKKIKSKIHFVLVLLFIIFLLILGYIRYSCMPHKDELLRKTEYLINSNSLIGKNIDMCTEYWKEEVKTYRSLNADCKAFYAGRITARVFGMTDSQYFYVIVYYENNVITNLEILPYKNG